MRRIFSPGPLIGIFVVALIVVAVALTVFSSSPVALDPDTPEGVVQQYLEAALDGDEETAAALLAEPVELDCSNGRANSLRVSLVGTTTSDDRVTVEVRITESSGGPFDGGGYTRTEAFRLRQTPDGWRITDWPWEFCWERPERP